MIKLSIDEREVLIDIIEKNECDCTLYELIKINYVNILKDISKLREITNKRDVIKLKELFINKGKTMANLLEKLPKDK